MVLNTDCHSELYCVEDVVAIVNNPWINKGFKKRKDDNFHNRYGIDS